MWKKINSSSKEIIEKYYKNNNIKICDYSFNNLLIWSIGDELEYLEEDETLFIRGNYLSEESYFLPLSITADKDAVIKGINKLLSIGHNIELVPEEWKKKLEEYYIFSEQRDSFDYIYLLEDLVNLKGKKYIKKRNRFNHFLKHYNHKYEIISKENIAEVLKFQEVWMEKREAFQCDELEKENKGIKNLLKNYENLNLIGGIIYVDRKIAAYTIGEKVGENMLIIHIEKGNEEFLGSYQAINSLFLKENGDKIIYVNREDDAGVPGLRNAKLSYSPIDFLKKYRITSKK